MDRVPLICEQIYCTGCMACYNICPQTAITMESDDRGFLYPFIYKDLCVNCHRCERVCPVLNPVVKSWNEQKYYAFKHNDIDVRLKSSSGGFFTWLSDIILDRNGVVYGSTYNDDLKVIHNRTETKIDRDAMRGSKYVQSYIGNIYQNLRCDLEKGRWVLFTGAPCQCEAVLSYLGKSINIEKLVTMDFICEGVVSPLLFEEFKKYENEKFKSEGELTNITFRDKERYQYKQKPIFARRLIMEFEKSIGGGYC